LRVTRAQGPPRLQRARNILTPEANFKRASSPPKLAPSYSLLGMWRRERDYSGFRPRPAGRRLRRRSAGLRPAVEPPIEHRGFESCAGSRSWISATQEAQSGYIAEREGLLGLSPSPCGPPPTATFSRAAPGCRTTD